MAKDSAKRAKQKTQIPSDDEQTPSLAKKHQGCLLECFGWFLLLLVVYYLGLCLFIDLYGHWDRAQRAQAIVILGARVDANHEPGDSLRARTLQAVRLYKRGIAPRIISTGGLGDNYPTEAEAAATLAVDHGVPDGAILREMESTTTWENAKNTAKICRAHHWTRVVAVSDPYHLWRVRRDFAAFGISAYTSPARECLRNRNFALRAEWTAREGLAIMRDQAMDACVWGWRKLR